MENINILIHKNTRQVDLSKSVIGNDGENLQENLVFSFDEFVNGTGRLEIVKPDKTKSYLMLTKVDETYQIPIKSVITKTGRIGMQLVITEGTNDEEIPIFKSNQFYVVCNSSINAEIEEPEEYPEWIDVANTKLNEFDNLDITATKEGHTATITITDKEGNETSVEIYDGSQGETGPQGPVGKDGVDATINGVNTLNIEAGENISITQSGSTLTISGEAGGTTDYSDLTNKPSINNVELSGNKTTSDLGIVIPDVSNFITKDVNNLTYYTLKTSTGSLIDLEINGTTYVITLSLKDIDGNVISSDTIDLPLESVVVGGEYDAQNQKIILTLQNGNTIDIPVGALISGLQTEITSQNKLASDLVDDTNSGNKFVSTSEKSTWDGKYDKPSGGIPSTDLSSAVQTSLGKADSAVQDISGKLDTSKVKNANSTTAGDVYDVRYINTLIGDIDSVLDSINNEVL